MKPAHTKLFQTGESQAVRLPRNCRFTNGESEVVVRKVGRRAMLQPLQERHDKFLSSLGSLSEDIPAPKQITVTKLRDALSVVHAF